MTLAFAGQRRLSAPAACLNLVFFVSTCAVAVARSNREVHLWRTQSVWTYAPGGLGLPVIDRQTFIPETALHMPAQHCTGAALHEIHPY